jgi:cell wall-associated NlpC family hydrolase
MPLPSWTREYIGVPFTPHGRTMKGCDCYGLVRIVLEDRFGVTLPVFDTEYEFGDQDSEEAAIDSGLFHLPVIKILIPSLGDLVFLRYFGHTSHIGIYLGDNFILHTTPERNACLDSLASPLLAKRVMGFYHVEGAVECR